ncbi:hypothetical protein OHA37_38355 [Streptomyces sp. NBC_00335]|uniref:hypothetical protein n=1 Tax=unclassified Streptomyces TaxID=2593676 RepID=UPI00224DEF62|nr:MULTISPECIES: hypothetical protein [unclassified Streptomyces]MCX5409708.1 hypothetical protein [Streptomyces sp. NBC_00086]
MVDTRWGKATDWITAMVATAALVISLLGYFQANDANNVARGATGQAVRANDEALRANHQAEQNARRAQAEQIAFYWQVKDGEGSLRILNTSLSYITDVVVAFDDGSYIDVGSLSGCTQWSLSPPSRTLPNGEVVALSAKDSPSQLHFTDAQDPSGTWSVRDRTRPQTTKPLKLQEISEQIHYDLSDTKHCG